MSIKHERQKTIYLYKNSQNLKLKINSEIILTLIEQNIREIPGVESEWFSLGWFAWLI